MRAGLLLLIAGSISCGACQAVDRSPAVGWSVSVPARGGPEQDGYVRYIVSGAADAVEEFTQAAQSNGWLVDARASALSGLVFAQFRAPVRLGETNSFIDQYLMERPRRLNIAGVVAPAEIAGPVDIGEGTSNDIRVLNRSAAPAGVVDAASYRVFEVSSDDAGRDVASFNAFLAGIHLPLVACVIDDPDRHLGRFLVLSPSSSPPPTAPAAASWRISAIEDRDAARSYLEACTSSPSRTATLSERRDALGRVARSCGFPPSRFLLVNPNDIHFRPSPDDPYESVACALRQLSQANIPLRTLGFVGNEAPAEQEQNPHAH